MHVGWMAVLDLPPGARSLEAALLRERIGGRLHLTPRFRQRVVQVPMRVSEPVWQDVPDFDLDRHVSTVGDESELDRAAMRAVADAFFSEQLDRDRPLWHILVVPRLAGGRAAVLGKVHHAMVDGIAAVELGMLMFDGMPDPAPAAPVGWSPGRQSGPVRLAVGSLTDTAVDQFRLARRAVSLARSPAYTVRMADTLRRAAVSLADDALHPAEGCYLNDPIGPRRTLVTHRVRLSRMLDLKQRHGATLNDITLAVCAGTLRRFAARRGDEPRDLRVMVPVSVRAAEEERSQGNRITFAFIDLPVSRARSEDRLAGVIEQMAELKTSGRIGGSSALLQGLGALPEPLKEMAARYAVSPRLYNLTISNVPGPRTALYAAGARVRSVYPVIPLPDRHALAVGILTYEDHAHFGLHADPGVLPRAGALPLMIDDSLAELELGSRARPVRPPERGRPRSRQAPARSRPRAAGHAPGTRR
jgi:diacylglycerol O-acyltransferase